MTTEFKFLSELLVQSYYGPLKVYLYGLVAQYLQQRRLQHRWCPLSHSGLSPGQEISPPCHLWKSISLLNYC